jgi:putative DNA methylase
VIAWLWVRTAKSPNPAFSQVDVPLASTFMLSTKAGKEAYLEPVIEGLGYRFTVKVGKPKDEERAKGGTKSDGRGANFRCLMSQTPISGDYLKAEGMAGRIGARLMAVVAEGNRGRVYLSPSSEHSYAAQCDRDSYRPTLELPKEGKGRTAFWCKLYGLTNHSKLFTPRQLVALTTFSDLVQEARERVKADALAAGRTDAGVPLSEGGSGAESYADAVVLYLTFAVSKAVDRNTSLCVWESKMDRMRGTFGRQALPMTWDYVETNPFGGAGGDIYGTVYSLCEVLDKLIDSGSSGLSAQCDAQTQALSRSKVVLDYPARSAQGRLAA